MANARIMKRTCSKETFEREHLGPGVPVVLMRVARAWPAFRKWSWDFLATEAKDDPVLLMLDGDRSGGARKESTVGEYLESFDQLRSTPTGTARPPSASVPYLREWAFANRHPEWLDDIEPMVYFDDLFAGCPIDERPSLTWLFIGPAGTFTPAHIDLWHTDAWIAQIHGRKRVRIWTKGDDDPDSGDKALINTPSLPYDFQEVILEPGDVLYLPSDTPHEVYALDDSISVSSNFMSAPRAAKVRPLYEDWLARRAVSRQIDMVKKRLRLLRALEELINEDSEEEGDRSSNGRNRGGRMNAMQRSALDEKGPLERRLRELQEQPHLGEWVPTTL